MVSARKLLQHSHAFAKTIDGDKSVGLRKQKHGTHFFISPVHQKKNNQQAIS